MYIGKRDDIENNVNGDGSFRDTNDIVVVPFSTLVCILLSIKYKEHGEREWERKNNKTNNHAQ